MFEDSESLQSDASDWANRSEFWLAESGKLKRRRRARERNSNPLILAGHGTTMRIEHGALLIRQGFTHYPQQQETHRFFRGDLALPRMIILLDGSGSLSFDVLSWLGEQGVALARVKWNGDASVFASGGGFAADADKLSWQYELRRNPSKRFTFACDLISRKLESSIATLQSQFPESRTGEFAIAKARRSIVRLKAGGFSEMTKILKIEGGSAAAYFGAWADIEMQWKSLGRHPVPEQWRSFRTRASILTGSKPKNWKASHPINAMLNYAYAVKAARLQIRTVAEGYDPYAGIMHHNREGFPAFVYDLIEPERPRVDALILGFVRKHHFSAADFIVRNDGACRLSPQLARAVASLTAGLSVEA